MEIDSWIGIIISAILSFAIAAFFGETLHWYLLIVLIVVGLFINTIIIILTIQDDHI